MPEPIKTIKYIQAIADEWENQEGLIVVETPVNLTVNGETWLTFMCTPIYQEALAVGFLYNEGLIQDAKEIADVRLCPEGDNVDVWLHHTLDKPVVFRRNSGCSVNVTPSTGDLPISESIVKVEKTLTPSKIGKLLDQFSTLQRFYRQSGGLHASALSDGEQIIFAAEDIGRNNTLDKIAGYCLMNNFQNSGGVLLTTGRISSEMLQKSAHLHASIIVSRTAVSSMAVQLAEAWGITLVGYSRNGHFNVYTHPQRIILDHQNK